MGPIYIVKVQLHGGICMVHLLAAINSKIKKTVWPNYQLRDHHSLLMEQQDTVVPPVLICSYSAQTVICL